MVLTGCGVPMRDTIRAETLLSLFTSADCAAAIAGDLTEDRRHRGPLLFWLDVVGTTSALWRHSVTDAPLRVMMLAALGCGLLAVPGLAGTAAVSLFPNAIGSPVSWIVLSFFWLGGALWTGASLVGIAPRRGLSACVVLAGVGGTLLTALAVRALWLDLLSVQLVVFYVTGLGTAASQLVGGAIARRRTIVRGIPTSEQHL